MKISFLALFLVVTAFGLEAQVSLIKNIGKNIEHSSISEKSIYYKAEPEGNVITFYNPDFTIYSETTIPLADGYSITRIDHVSEHVFNTNAKVEFTVYSEKWNAAVMEYEKSFKLFDEEGTELFDFGRASSGDVYVVDGSYRFQCGKYDASWVYDSEDVYQLAAIPTLAPSITSKSALKSSAFPNPAVDYINLPYSIENGVSTNLTIYGNNGQLIDNKRIGSDFSYIRLDVSNYKPGVYYYKYNNESSKFVVK